MGAAVNPASPPVVAGQAAGSDVPAPRSLRSLLHQLDEDYKDAEPPQEIGQAASQSATPNAKKAKKTRVPRKPLAPAFFARMRKIAQSLKRLTIKLFRSLSLLVRFATGLLLLGGVALIINNYRPDLTELANKVEVPKTLKPATTTSPVASKTTAGKAAPKSRAKPTATPKPKAKAKPKPKPKPKPVLAPPSALLKTIPAHKGGVLTVLLSAEGGRLISTGADRIIKIWDIDDGVAVQTFEPHEQAITTLDISGDRLVQGDSRGNIFLFDLARTEQLATFKAVEGPIRAVAFAGRGNNLITGSDRGELTYWEFKDGEYYRIELRGSPHAKSIRSIVTHRRYIVSASADNSFKLWQNSRKRLIRTYQSHAGPVNAVALSPKAYRLASGSSDDTIKIWSPRSRRLRRTLQADQEAVLSLAFAENGKWLASGGADHSIKVWNARNGKLVRVFKGHAGAVRKLMFSPDQKRLISASDDGTIRFWRWNPR